MQQIADVRPPVSAGNGRSWARVLSRDRRRYWLSPSGTRRMTFYAYAPGAVAGIVAIDIDKAVALAHLAGGRRDQIDAAPAGVTHHRNAVADSIAHCPDVLAQVADAIVVIDVPIGIDLIAGAKPVFHQNSGF